MLCFAFSGDPTTKIHLAEEIIRYSAHRDDGVAIGLVVLLTSGSVQGAYLMAIHRCAVGLGKAAATTDWADQTQENDFPYLHIFSHLTKQRLVLGDPPQCRVSPIPGSLEASVQTAYDALILAPPQVHDFGVSDYLGMSSDTHADMPFTCIRIGPFPQANTTYLFGFECRIEGQAYEAQIPEDVAAATRLYQVYGPDHMFSHIENVDIPRALSGPNSADYSGHLGFIADTFKPGLLLPETYSVVAVDNPNCDPRKIRCLDLTHGLTDLTDNIDKGVYAHPGTEAIPGRLHWFACSGDTGRFYLQMIGPMAQTDVLSAGVR